MAPRLDSFKHPHDTLASSSLRFLSELIAWISGPWALAQSSRWLVLPAIILLVGIPAIFSSVNDKRHVIIATPGPVRAGLELILYVVALTAPWFVWPSVACGTAVAIVIASLGFGMPRTLWLIRGAQQEK